MCYHHACVVPASRRLLHNGGGNAGVAAGGLSAGASLAVLGLAGYGTYTLFRRYDGRDLRLPFTVRAAQIPESQSTVSRF